MAHFLDHFRLGLVVLYGQKTVAYAILCLLLGTHTYSNTVLAIRPEEGVINIICVVIGDNFFLVCTLDNRSLCSVRLCVYQPLF